MCNHSMAPGSFQEGKGKTMKYTILLNIEETNENRADAYTREGNESEIVIAADSVEAAAELLREGISKACEAMARNWKPYEKGTPWQQIPAEVVKDILESDRAGMAKKLADASEFTAKLDRGYTAEEWLYLVSLTYKDIWQGTLQIQNISFKRGYLRAMYEVNKKNKQKRREEVQTMRSLDNYINENGISKAALASDLGISVKKLNRILNTPDSIIDCATYGRLCKALRISADKFIE